VMTGVKAEELLSSVVALRGRHSTRTGRPSFNP